MKVFSQWTPEGGSSIPTFLRRVEFWPVLTRWLKNQVEVWLFPRDIGLEYMQQGQDNFTVEIAEGAGKNFNPGKKAIVLFCLKYSCLFSACFPEKRFL